MDKGENIIEKIRQYKELVIKNFPLKIEQFWLFGSYVKGNSNKDSDIDIALEISDFGDNYDFFSVEPLLWKIRRNIDLRIEPHLIARNTDYAGFLNEIHKTGIEI
ncbi:MAG: nucleotidyltransferase domain-containing protein [Bacteroidales bacterium]|jgi:predicted nucleotidyltransferase|nr:nucleotidyltransferase domain-containing protein [Bacteroidales bacterium]